MEEDQWRRGGAGGSGGFASDPPGPEADPTQFPIEVTIKVTDRVNGNATEVHLFTRDVQLSSYAEPMATPFGLGAPYVPVRKDVTMQMRDVQNTTFQITPPREKAKPTRRRRTTKQKREGSPA